MKTLKKTNTNEFKTVFFNHLLECIDVDENETASAEEKIQYVFDRFNSEFSHPYEIKRNPSDQNRLAEWLSGLAINIPYMNYDILETAKRMHEVSELTEKQEDAILANHWNFYAFKLLQLREVMKKGQLTKYGLK